MIFSWFTSSTSIQTHDRYDPNQEDQLQQLSATTPFTKEEDGWVQIITAAEEEEEDDQKVPGEKNRKVNDKDEKDVALATTTTTPIPTAAAACTAIEPKKISRQQRRYHARLAQQQALKKQKQVAGEEQLKMAMKLGQQCKSRQKQWADRWIPHSISVTSGSSCSPTRSTSLTAGLE